jgi:hypothetical protein
MAIALTIFLFLLGAFLMVVAGVLLAVRQAVTQFMAGFPPMMRDMVVNSDPKVKRSLDMIERFPKFAAIGGGVGVLVYLWAILRLHSHIAQAVYLVLAVVTALIWHKYRGRLTDLLKKQFTDQMQKQAAKMPKPTPAQAKAQFRTMQQTAREKVESRPPTNRSERRAAQQRKK